MAHPRVSGENEAGAGSGVGSGGSSPRERGKRAGIYVPDPVQRLIPA